MDTLDILREARSAVCSTFDQQQQFDNYLIGVLSSLVPAEMWKEAISSTRDIYTERHGGNDGRVHASAA